VRSGSIQPRRAVSSSLPCLGILPPFPTLHRLDVLDEASGKMGLFRPRKRSFGLAGKVVLQHRFGMNVLTEFFLAARATHLHCPFRSGRPKEARIISLVQPDQQWYMSGLAIEIAR
jgi:hypothetical protein